MENLDPREYARRRLREIRPEFVWDTSVGAEWKAALRDRLAQVIGLPTEPKPRLDSRIEATSVHDGYRRETVTFATRLGLRAFGYLLIPDEVAAASPAVICVPGHGKGVDALVGEAPLDYQNQFALQCVRRGLVTLAIEPISFGHRQSALAVDRGSSCVSDSMAALMLGESMIGWRTHEAMVAVDYLESRAEVDDDRIGIMGISGGGLVALWATAFDERIRATVVSGYFNTFFDSILSIDHCVDNFAPRLAQTVEMPDLAALIAPRFLFVESGIEDPIFPIPAFRRACQRAQEIYGENPAHFQFEEFPGDHFFHGKKAIPALQEWLQR